MKFFNRLNKFVAFILAIIVISVSLSVPVFAWFFSENRFTATPADFMPFSVGLSSPLGALEFNTAYPFSVQAEGQRFTAFDDSADQIAQPAYVRFILSGDYSGENRIGFINANGDVGFLRRVSLTHYSPDGSNSVDSFEEYYVYPFALSSVGDFFELTSDFHSDEVLNFETIIANNSQSELRWGVSISNGDVVASLAAVPNDVRAVEVEDLPVIEEVIVEPVDPVDGLNGDSDSDQSGNVDNSDPIVNDDTIGDDLVDGELGNEDIDKNDTDLPDTGDIDDSDKSSLGNEDEILLNTPNPNQGEDFE